MSTRVRLLDTGVWIALAFAKHPHYSAAVEVFESASSVNPIGFCRATQNSFLRLLTTPKIQAFYESPAISNKQAWAKSQELLALPEVIWLAEPAALESEWKKCGCVTTASPKIWMDAYLAAFAIAGGFELVTLDRDFVTFSPHGLRLQLIGAHR